MNYTYRIREDLNLIDVAYAGIVSVGETIAFVDRIMADARFRPGMNSISDLTEATFDWSLTEIDRYRAYVKSIDERAGDSKWALISKGGVTERNAKLFIVLNEIEVMNIKVRLFDNRDDAFRWVTQSQPKSEKA